MEPIVFCGRCRGMRVGLNKAYIFHCLVCREMALRSAKSLFFTGVLSSLIFAFPINSAFALAIVLGAWLAILGIMEIGASIRLRRLSSTVEEFRGRGAVAPAG